ncbi:hypothetical protein HDU79_008092 [Rhizoclosmatium sp. JEL0117]|nr:hypothetical protein HDU79_008092 [Rhizoclosmatium sp. JEL0117]
MTTSSNLVRFNNVAVFVDNERLVHETSVVVSRESGKFVAIEGEAKAVDAAVEVDASGYLMLPGLVDAGIIGGDWRGIKSSLSLDAALKAAAAHGTCVAVVDGFSEKVGAEKGRPVAIRYNADGDLSLAVSQSKTVAASKKEKKELVASGALAISESPSVWPGVRELAVSSLPEWDGDSNESSKTAVALRRVLESVSSEAAKVLGIEERRGVVSKDAFADFMLVKLNPEWELSTVADSIAAADIQTSRFNTIPEAIDAMKRGDFVIVVDNEDRENEGDFIIAAEDVTEEKMAFMIRYSGGVVCVPMEGSRLDALKLPLMVTNNEDSLKTAYTISVDYKHGTTTGISSHDRAMTLRQLANPTSQPTDFTRPGHVFPLRAHENGVLSRVGHTEASLDLCRLAGKQPCAGISEVVLDEGGMARRDDLLEMGRKWGLCVVTIDALVKYRVENGV